MVVLTSYLYSRSFSGPYNNVFQIRTSFSYFYSTLMSTGHTLSSSMEYDLATTETMGGGNLSHEPQFTYCYPVLYTCATLYKGHSLNISIISGLPVLFWHIDLDIDLALTSLPCLKRWLSM